MRRATTLVLGALLVGVAALTPATAPSAEARGGNGGGQVFRYPGDLSETQLRILLQSSEEPATVVFATDTYVFSPQLYIYNRSNITLCSATGRAGDVVIESDGGGAGAGANAAVLLEQARNVTLRDLTIRGTAVAGSQGVRLNAQLGTSFASFVDTVTIDGCVVEAARPIVATAAARRLTVVGSRIVQTATDSFGLQWGDGDTLLVTRTTFETASGVEAFAAVYVEGAAAAFSEGDRARRVILTRNRVRGAYARAFDLLDVVECRVRGNRVDLRGGAVRPGTPITGSQEWGRVGIVVRRADASALPDDVELLRNKVRGAYYGAWLVSVGAGVVARNDFRRNGSADPDELFAPEQDDGVPERGGGLRITLFGGVCRIDVTRNDLRDLRSPQSFLAGDGDQQRLVEPPAIVVLPADLSGACFADGDGGNKTSKGRELF